MAGAAAGIGCTVLAFWLLNLTVRPAPIGPGHVLQFPWFIVIPAIFFVGVVLTWQNLTGHLWFILEVRTTSSRVTHPFSIRRLGNGDVHRLTEELNRALRERMRGPTQPTSASVSEP